MGAGRKTVTHTMDHTVNEGYDAWSKMQRNLGENLGGCIFGCTDDTYEECVTGGIFGLPRNHMLYVQYVQPGMPVFLFSYTNRKLHGIFKAVSEGGLYNQYGWNGGVGTTRTRFPAQVRVEVYQQCPPLQEKDYKPILKDCYIWDGVRSVLVFELTKTECANLCRKFAGGVGGIVPGLRPQPKAAVDKDGFTQVVSKKAFVPAAGPSGSAWGTKPKPAGLAAIQEASVDTVLPGDPFGGTEEVPVDTPKVFHPPPPTLLSAECAALNLNEMHDAIHALSPPAASYLWKVIGGICHLLDVATQERIAMATLIRTLQENEARLVQEAYSLRKDLSFVGEQINVVVPDTSDGIRELMEQKPSNQQELYLIGGDYELSPNNSERMTAVEVYTTSCPAMRVAALDDEARRVNAAAAGMGRSIYICGGAMEDRGWLNSCLRFDVDSQEYVPIAPMKHHRGGFDAVSLDGKIYVVGGTGLGGLYHNHGECYDPVVDEWYEIPKMSKRRFNCTLETMNGSLFCVGGFDGGAYLTTVERYDPREPVGWKEVASNGTKRAAHACEVLGTQMYIMGGYGSASSDPSSFLSTTEVYDPAADAWMPGPDMDTPRAYGNSGVLDGYLYVLCGVNAVPSAQGMVTTHYNHSIQYLNVISKAWEEVTWPQTVYPTGRAYGVAAVL